MTIEQLIQVLREQGYILDLSSTHIGAGVKYSAKFSHKSDEECDDCYCNIPNTWEYYAHANRLEYAILKAAKAINPPLVLVNTEVLGDMVVNGEGHLVMDDIEGMGTTDIGDVAISKGARG